MFLKSLLLRGFKTFADATEIELGVGARITAIVGPNGCGKSNLLDSVRWVLGEDNPRDLRVSSLSDIIFAGTARRKPVSLGEVSLLFDNSSGKLPLPYSEVSIKRRAFREGESEFYINKNLCRLKDIKDLLLDTGLGEGSYAIITQGQVDAILSSKGEERRALFEEAAGINKYKTRKVSAEKKLIAAEQNILRISDLKIEVSEHLLTLEEQSKKATEYLKVQNQVKELEIGLCKKVLGALIEKKIKLEGELASTKLAATEKVTAEQKGEAELVQVKEAIRKLEIEIEEKFGKLDAEKDRLRDLELNRLFIEGEAKREERSLIDLENKRLSLTQKLEALRSVDGPQIKTDGPHPHFADTLHVISSQAREVVNLLSSITSFFGQEEMLQLLGEKDREAAIALKAELLEDELKKTAEEIDRARFGLAAHKNQLAGLTAPGSTPESKAALTEEIAKLKAERDKLRTEAIALEEAIRLEEKKQRETENQSAAIEIALAKVDGEMQGIGEKLSGEYNLTLPEVEALPYTVANSAKAKQEIEEGKHRLRALEPVNLLAIEEFEKNRDRLSFIDSQLTDLNSARENLQTLIVELDAKAEETFNKTMSELSVVFSETFAKLFVGGEASIRLAPGKPALEADIEISVRPSGRRWLSLSLLSGGERSLSAIAILFSLMKIRPSPFCFMDEVDAALDEANIGRFTAMLQDFAANTQIMVITHNKRTMAVANNIYGVTMEEPGISKIISMKLTELAAA
ncbi:MAG: chromosome segregation SMC family protein [bacterium]